MPKKVLLCAMMLGVVAFCFCQESPRGLLDRGIQLFESEQYRESLDAFGALLADPQAKEERPDALYWSTLAYIASGEGQAAERSIAAFLTAYPGNSHVSDLLYQRGRLLYARGEYESALASFASFMAAAPSHELYPSALYWSGECLYSLGHLEEAERAFAAVVDKFPKSVKVEAASYRRALIGLEFREEELLKLLTWSHEESLRIVEDFRRRERAYEQALAVYQKQIADAKRGVVGDPEQELADLRARVAELSQKLATSEADLASVRSEISKLKADAQLAASATPVAPAPGTLPPAAAESPSGLTAEALAAKSRALDLLAFYLEHLAGGSAK